MPLLGRQPFVRQKLKLNTQQLDKQYFYCKHTQEIFLDYESLFQRVIQCNSLVWSCSLTARLGLTFQEAVESEKKARSILATFPEPLKQPVLYIASLTTRNRIGDLCDDVYYYVRDRYFVGESVEVLFSDGDRRVCEVTAVSSTASPVKASKSPKKNGPQKDQNVDPAKLRYELCETDDAEEIQICHVVEGKDLSRPRGSYSKNTNKLFIKQHVALKGGKLVVKDSSMKKYELDSPDLKKITGNVVPDFASLNRTSPKSKNGQLDITKAFKQKNGNKKSSKGAEGSHDSDEVNKKFVEAKMKKMKEKEMEKEAMREEKLLIAKFKMEWNRPRDDLECDDLKDMPVPTKVKCDIPDEVFGDALMILEFVHQFSSLLKSKRTYPHGLAFETLEKALVNSDIDGPFNDLLQMMLLAVLKQQEEEGEEQVGVKDPDKKLTVNDENLDDDHEDLSTTKAISASKVAATWPQYYHGTILRKMPLDSFTVTEMLRLHLLASGSEVFPGFYERGMFVSHENPGLYFKMEHPEIIKLLATSNVFQLTAAQRIKVLNVLMAQLLTYESYREFIEESAKTMKNAQYALKQLRWARSRRGKEEKNKKKPDDKSKEGENANSDEKPSSPKPELTAEEKAVEDAKFLEQSLKKEKELVSQIEKLHGISALHPLGLDRGYRRYWVFKSVGGIFVEENDPFVGDCLYRPTPSQPASMFSVKSQDELPLSFMRKYLNTHKKEDKNGQSDKENESVEDSSNHNHSKAQKLLSDANPRINSPLKVNKRNSSASSDGIEDKDLIKKDFGVCSADPVSCPVHGSNRTKQRTCWSFFYTEEQIDSLIACLNPRGFREGQLIESLSREKVNLIHNISSCPVNKLTDEILVEEQITEVRKSNRNKSVFYNIPPEEALISTFRDALLENEDKLWSGALGVIKVNDRKQWRESIMDGDYDMQTNFVKWAIIGKRLNGGKVEQMETQGEDDKSSQRSSSPSLIVSPVILDLASALLQVAQGLEHKYIIPPLADDDKYKKHKQKMLEKQEKTKKADNGDEVENLGKGTVKSPFQRWEESLMNSTSISQLFIHLATLERSITWHKAARNASCRICRKRGDPENMLLCDGCDKGYHMYCLKPPLTSVPTGDWFCPPCEPPQPRKETRVAKSYKELSDSEEEEEEEEEQEEEEEVENEQDEEEEEAEDEENEEVEEVEEEENDDEEEEEEEIEVQEEEEEEEESSGEDETDYCMKCKTGGELICCDSCTVSYHLQCLSPPLKKIPRGSWKCDGCEAETPSKKGSRSSNKRARSSTPEDKGVVQYTNTSSSRSSRRLANETKGLPLDYHSCSKILTLLSQHRESWPFLRAVTKKEAPDYHKIIKRPIDLGIIRSRLNNQTYLTNSQFAADVYLMFQNCEVYNAAESQQYLSGKKLARYFQSLLRQYKLDDSNKRSSDTGLPDAPIKRSRQ